MKKLSLLLLLLLATLPSQSACVIRYVNDAAGNRILRYYDCGNSDPDPQSDDDYPASRANNNSQHATSDISPVADGEGLIANLAPNPTSGTSLLTFSKILVGATILITDGKGAVVRQDKINSASYTINLNGVASGTYYISIQAISRRLSFKLDKL